MDAIVRSMRIQRGKFPQALLLHDFSPQMSETWAELWSTLRYIAVRCVHIRYRLVSLPHLNFCRKLSRLLKRKKTFCHSPTGTAWKTFFPTVNVTDLFAALMLQCESLHIPKHHWHDSNAETNCIYLGGSKKSQSVSRVICCASLFASLIRLMGIFRVFSCESHSAQTHCEHEIDTS